METFLTEQENKTIIAESPKEKLAKRFQQIENRELEQKKDRLREKISMAFRKYKDARNKLAQKWLKFNSYELGETSASEWDILDKMLLRRATVKLGLLGAVSSVAGWISLASVTWLWGLLSYAVKIDSIFIFFPSLFGLLAVFGFSVVGIVKLFQCTKSERSFLWSRRKALEYQGKEEG